MIDPIELHALADGELAPEREGALRRDLSSSAELTAEMEAILTVKRILREKTPAIECRAEWKACVGRLNELDRTRKVEHLVSGRRAWGLAGGLCSLILLAGFLNRGQSGSANVRSADLAAIATSFGPSRDAKDTVFDKSLDSLLAQAKKSIDPNRLTIMSTAYGEADGRPVTRLTLRDASGDLALILVPDVLPLDGLQQDHSFRLGHIGQMKCVAWTEGPYTLLMVGDRGYEDLVTAASRISLHGAPR